jgi:hypothetical protein
MGVEVAIGAAVVGGLFSAYSAVQQGQAAAAQAAYQSQVAQNNALIAKQNATYARQSAEVKAVQTQYKTAALIGSIRAAQAANGLDVNEGTNVDVQAGADVLGKLDEKNIRIAGEREAYGYETQAMNFQASRGLYDFQGDMASRSIIPNVIGSFIGTAASVGSKWAAFQSSGLLSGGSSWGSSLDSWGGMIAGDSARIK